MYTEQPSYVYVSVGVGTDSWSLVCSHWALTVLWLSEVIVVIHETKMMLTFSQLSLITMGLQLFSSKSFRCLLMITTARCSVNAHKTHYHDSTLQSSIICTYVPTYLSTVHIYVLPDVYYVPSLCTYILVWCCNPPVEPRCIRIAALGWAASHSDCCRLHNRSVTHSVPMLQPSTSWLLPLTSPLPSHLQRRRCPCLCWTCRTCSTSKR